MRALWNCRDRQHGLLVALSDILRRRTILVSKAEMASSRHATKFMGTRPNDLGFPSCGKSDSRLILGIGQKRAFALDVPGIRVLTQLAQNRTLTISKSMP